MIDIKQFAAWQKKSKHSFAIQRRVITQVMAGQEVLCDKCKQPLQLFTPEGEGESGIRCQKGCTDIQLDFV